MSREMGRRVVPHRSPDVATRSSLFFRLLSRAREADSYVPVSTSLGIIGGLLLALSTATSLYRLLSVYPELLAVAMGLACLLGSALSCHRGLIRFVPQSVQCALFRRTPFELMFDESEVTNVVRRWVRVYLLCQDRSEHEIQTIVRGLDPEFLDKVFRKSIVHMLPDSLCQLLLPRDQLRRLGISEDLQPSPAWHGGIKRVSGVGSLLARCLAIPGHGRQQGRLHSSEDAAATVLSPSGIRELLRQKSQEKRTAAREPALTPVVRALVWKIGSLDPARDPVVHPVAEQGLVLACATSMAAAVMCGGASLFFFTPMARSVLRRVAFQGDASTVSDAKASRAALFVSGISLLGALSSAAVALHVRHHWLWKMPPEKAAVVAVVEDELAGSGGDRTYTRTEPETEESPENSSTEESDLFK